MGNGSHSLHGSEDQPSPSTAGEAACVPVRRARGGTEAQEGGVRAHGDLEALSQNHFPLGTRDRPQAERSVDESPRHLPGP